MKCVVIGREWIYSQRGDGHGLTPSSRNREQYCTVTGFDNTVIGNRFATLEVGSESESE